MLAMKRLSVATPVPQLGPAVTVEANVRELAIVVDCASPPTWTAVPQMDPPFTETASCTTTLPELSITPSWVTVPSIPDGLVMARLLPVDTLIVPVAAFVKVDVFCGRL